MCCCETISSARHSLYVAVYLLRTLYLSPYLYISLSQLLSVSLFFSVPDSYSFIFLSLSCLSLTNTLFFMSDTKYFSIATHNRLIDLANSHNIFLKEKYCLPKRWWFDLQKSAKCIGFLILPLFHILSLSKMEFQWGNICVGDKKSLTLVMMGGL